jgi:hypothetical protein
MCVPLSVSVSLLRWRIILGNVRMILRELVWEVDDWFHLAQDREQQRAHVNRVMKLQVLD